MKTKCIVFLTLLILVILGCGIDTTQSDIPDCVVSNTFNDEYSLTIIANREKIEDKELLAKELVEMVRNNDFKTILFSYDEVGYPTRLEMTVYLNEKDWQNHNSVMRISLTQHNILDNYNIVEHIDKFQLELQ